MIERELLLHSTAAILLGALAWRFPRCARRFGRAGLALYSAGALWPLLDTGLLYLTTADRIDQLSSKPLLAAPVYALAAFGALGVLGACWRRNWGWPLVLGLGAGYAAHVALAVLTPVGWPLLAPFATTRVLLPILPVGHPPLLVLLAVALLVLWLVPRTRSRLPPVAVVLSGVYLLAGAVQYGVVRYQAQALRQPRAALHVYPDNAWLTRWQVVLESPERYTLWRHRVHEPSFGEPRSLPRWNDQALTLKLLGDTVVRRYYFNVFRHPVVRVDVSGQQLTLLMHELEDQLPLVPGRTFYLESDLTGRNRFYQLQRFN